MGSRSPSDAESDEVEALRARVRALEVEATRHARGERAARALAAVARELAGTLDPDVVSQRIADSVRGLLGALASALFRPRPGSGDLVALATSGEWGLTEGVLVVPAGTGLVGCAVREATPLATADILDDPRIILSDEGRVRVERAGYRAVLAVPLRVRDAIVGALAVADRRGRVFLPEEIALVESFADQAALALENARLFAETRERLAETETLLAVGHVLSQPLPVEEAMRRVAREVARAFRADMVGAYFLDPRREVLMPIAGYRVPKHLVEAFAQTPLVLTRFPFLREALETRRPVWTDDYVHDLRFDQEFLAADRPRAALFAPTFVHGDIMGGLGLVWWTPPPPFGDAVLRLIEGVAAQVGLALENAELARQTREKLEEMERLLSVGRALSSTLELMPLLRHFLRPVAQTIQADSVGVWLIEPATGLLEPLAGYRVPREMLARLQAYRIDPAKAPFYAEAISGRKVAVSRDVASDPRVPRSLVELAPHRAQLFAPIVAKDQVIGALVAAWWTRDPTFSERDVSLVEAIGAQAGVALENARLFEENRRKLEELSALHGISRAVTGQLETQELTLAIHREVGRVLDARDMVVFLYDEERDEFEVALRMKAGAPDPNPQVRYPGGTGLMSVVVARRAPVRTMDYRATCLEYGVPFTPTGLDFPHWLGVPMAVGDQVLGVLALRSATRPFAETDERLLANIASLCALALKSARLYEERAAAFSRLRDTQEQLIRTEKLRALGEMAAGVAHDFNNLLAVILGRTELLLRGAREPAVARGLQTVRQAALDGAQTVRRIQEFTRTRGTRPLVAVDLAEVVREVVEQARPQWEDEARRRGVGYEVTVEEGALPSVAARPEELREVFTNLLNNAIEAMPGGGQLRFRLMAEGEFVVATVTDGGCGMSEETVRRVFEPFFTTKGSRGSGLGLSVVWGIVARHGGTIEVESRVGSGSTFTVRLPVARDLAGVEPTSGPPRSAPGARILVIDDEPAVREILRDLLAAEGYVVHEAGDGAAGLALGAREPFDLLVTDVSMPGMSGWEVAAASLARFPELPVGLITGWGDQLDPGELRRHRIRFVLAKPFEGDEALRRIGETLARLGTAD